MLATRRNGPARSLRSFQILLPILFLQCCHLSCSFSVPRRDFLTTTTLTTIMSSTSTTDSNQQTNDDSTIHWGIVGLGDVTQTKSGPPFWKCNGSELVTVMRRTPGKAQEFAKRVPNLCIGYDNLEAMLQHPGLQAVYVCTRPGTHLEIGRQVAQAGKACYMEKPVGRCAAETQELDRLFKELPFYTAYISRAYERTQALRRLLLDGVIGDQIFKISYTLVGTGGARDMDTALPWRLDPKQSGGGLVMDVGCHVLDRIDYLCGPLGNVQGHAENRNSPNVPVEDYVHLTAEIASSSWSDARTVGAKVECTWDFASTDQAPKDELVFSGTKGSIQMAGMSPDGPIRVFDSNGKMLQEMTFETPEHTAQLMIQAVTDDLRGLGSADYLSRGGNALRTSKVLDAVLSTYYGNRDIGYWEQSYSWPGTRSIGAAGPASEKKQGQREKQA